MPIIRFANEYELQKVVQRCHNILWERHGFDPAQAFDEFSKLLFVKLYDETVAGGARVAIRRSEPAEDFAARVRWLFEQANQTPGFEGIFSDEPIAVDDGIFTNRNLARVREYIRENAQILAVIELPDWAFIPSGTSVRGSLLFIRRMAPPPADYHIFMKRVEHIGFTSTGHPDPQNDFIATLAEFKSQDPRYMVAVDRIRGRLDAKFYLRKHQAVVDLVRHNPKHKLVKLSDIGTFHTDKVNPRRFPDADINLIETSCVDPATLTITPRRIKGSESNYTSLKVLRAGDILISRRRAYRGAIVIVPPRTGWIH